MNWTVGDILPEVARHADGAGVSLDSQAGRERALQVYNEIVEELMADDSWEGAFAHVEFAACEQCIALPSQFEGIRALTIDSRPSAIRPGSWRYLQQGPGGLADGCGLDGIMDLGDGFATARDTAEPMALVIYSDKPEAATASAIIQGTDETGREIAQSFPGRDYAPGEQIQIVGAAFSPTGGTPDQPFVTRAKFARRPSLVTKTVTNGHVYLLGHKADADPVWLATYRPQETRPSYRRYQLPSATDRAIVAKVDLRFIPAVHESERALIQFRPAIKIYAQALAARDGSRFDDYQRYRNSALAKLRSVREKKVGMQSHLPNFSTFRSGASIATARRR